MSETSGDVEPLRATHQRTKQKTLSSYDSDNAIFHWVAVVAVNASANILIKGPGSAGVPLFLVDDPRR